MPSAKLIACSACGRTYSREAVEKLLRQDILPQNKPDKHLGAAQYSAKCSCGGVILRRIGSHKKNANGKWDFSPDREIVSPVG